MIYDFLPVSLADYPGKVAATVFVSGCNFKCPYCHNSSLIKPQEPLKTQSEFMKYLRQRRALIDGVCITGGEPTLWNGLRKFIIDIKEEGFDVKLDTNGSRPDVLETLMNDKLLDYIAMDIKAPLAKYNVYAAKAEDIFNVKKSMNLIMASETDYEFRTTVNQNLLSVEDFSNIADLIANAKRYVLQPYKYSEGVLNKYVCGVKPCDPRYMEEIKSYLVCRMPNIMLR